MDKKNDWFVLIFKPIFLIVASAAIVCGILYAVSQCFGLGFNLKWGIVLWLFLMLDKLMGSGKKD